MTMKFNEFVKSILKEDNQVQELIPKDFEDPKYLLVEPLAPGYVLVIELEKENELPYEVEVYAIVDTATQDIDPTKKKVVGRYESVAEWYFATQEEAEAKFDSILASGVEGWNQDF